MRMFLYTLGILSNMWVILLLPSASAQLFLKAYSLGSMVLGVCIVYAFSKPSWARALEFFRLWLLALVFGMMCLSVYFLSPVAAAVSYVAALLLSDYYITQSGRPWHVSLYRVSLVVSVLPSFFNVDTMNDWLVPSRTLVALACLGLLNFGGRPLAQLKVANPLFYVTGTHFFYFGSLWVMALVLTDPALRVWYLGTQIGHGLVLKLMDFRIRRGAEVSAGLEWSVAAVSTAVCACMAAAYWDPLALLSYFISMLGLQWVTRTSKLK